MAKNIYMKSFGLAAAWQRLADVPTVLTATLTMSPTNAQPGLVRVDGGAPATWAKGVANVFVGVDLFRIEVSGTPGDTALIVGGTW